MVARYQSKPCGTSVLLLLLLLLLPLDIGYRAGYRQFAGPFSKRPVILPTLPPLHVAFSIDLDCMGKLLGIVCCPIRSPV